MSSCGFKIERDSVTGGWLPQVWLCERAVSANGGFSHVMPAGTLPDFRAAVHRAQAMFNTHACSVCKSL